VATVARRHTVAAEGGQVGSITALHFCGPRQGEDRAPRGNSSSSGLSLPAPDTEVWWPLCFPHIDDLGTLLLLKELPATVALYIRLVAYGDGSVPMRILVTAEEPPLTLLSYNFEVEFTPAELGRGPGYVSWVRRVPRMSVPAPGLYRLSATLGDEPPVTLPLFVDSVSSFLADWHERTSRLGPRGRR
jgi:hypothetical protein